MNTGTVKFFNESKRFGSIIDDATSKEYYVHSNDLLTDILKGDKVVFELREIDRGVQVVNVRSIS